MTSDLVFLKRWAVLPPKTEILATPGELGIVQKAEKRSKTLLNTTFPGDN